MHFQNGWIFMWLHRACIKCYVRLNEIYMDDSLNCYFDMIFGCSSRFNVLCNLLELMGLMNGLCAHRHIRHIRHIAHSCRPNVCISFECINVTSFMQYAYYVQFNTSFNTLQPILCLHLRKNDKRLFRIFGADGRTDGNEIKFK